MIVAPKLVKIKKAYPYMERLSNSSTYKFRPKESKAKNRHLVFENFQILSCHNGKRNFTPKKNVSWKSREAKEIQLEK